MYVNDTEQWRAEGGTGGTICPGARASKGPGGPEPQRIPTGPGPEEREGNVE